MLPRFLSKLPIFNFVVATTALGFQVAVLYPWHHELSQQNQKLALQSPCSSWRSRKSED